MIPFEQTGLQRIRKYGSDAERACGFQTLLVVQPAAATEEGDSEDGRRVSVFVKSEPGKTGPGERDIGTAGNFSIYAMIVECHLSKRDVELEFSFDTSVLEENQLCRSENNLVKLEAINVLAGSDLRDIWSWNSNVPSAVNACVYDLIVSTVRRQPEAPATGIRAYCEGVGAEVIVPLCFEKSMWTPVAILGVMKAGGASVAMDTSQPEERLRLIQPSNTLCIVFISGSTGQLKGIALTHRNFASSLAPYGAVFKIKDISRVFDFTLYSFDFMWSSFCLTLTTGGVLYVPSDYERKDDIVGALERYNPTFAFFTPTLARIIPLGALRRLNTLVLGECTVMATHVNVDRDRIFDLSIRCGVANNTWIVSHDSLALIGAIGELWLEGPLVGRGYLNDPEKTDTTFVEDPPWLLHRGPGRPGRRGRLYRTGDLVRYAPDGSLIFIGRKDDQVKIRGQRVELGEVEYHVRNALVDVMLEDDSSQLPPSQLSEVQVVAEVVTPKGGDRPALVAFVRLGAAAGPTDDEGHAAAVRRLALSAETRLAACLPVYMIPSACIPLLSLPLTATGKTDRRQLRRIGSTLGSSDACSFPRSASKRLPSTDLEFQIQHIWSKVLNVSDAIGVDDDFFRLGGDSITAMQSAIAARNLGIHLSAADLFKYRTIFTLAPRCSLLEDIISPCSPLLALEPLSQSFPLTPIQAYYLSRNPDPLTCFDQCFLLQISRQVEPFRVRLALRTLVERHSMLRARFSFHAGVWSQIVTDFVDESFHFECTQLKTNCVSAAALRQARSILNIQEGPLVSAVLANQSNQQFLFLTIHHLVVDLVSWRVLLAELEDILMSRPLQPIRSISFQSWASIQSNYARQHLEPETSFPTSLKQQLPDYWGLSNDEVGKVPFSVRNFALDKQVSLSLLGPCNDLFGTRPLELMIAALLFSFGSVFHDRPIPAVFNEGHGREILDDSMDLSETVGWFTTMFPIQVNRTQLCDIQSAIQATKQFIRNLPHNGWSYFTSKYLNARGVDAFAVDSYELNFNYLGVFQQVERAMSLFRRLDIPPDSRPDSISRIRAFSVFDVVASVENGEIVFEFKFDPRVQHLDEVECWVRLYQKTLEEIAISAS
ncbi:nonribosomal peptide synthase [Penicillium chrysogenum]|uniref:nonribosomal peptide synthase n=1 Tax=Penicillium chrysogenum TaxID=5076 RepID=UPI0024DF1009|nr:nonribosomal peptide synthase [Penicillium chrysogenum]KAJ5230978.1 nonribosomal peptide synthase [Penicillium chrysogenum]